MMNKQQSARIDTIELKADIVRRIGRKKAVSYFHQLGRLISFKVSKKEFGRYCAMVFGKENLHLHNQLIGAILKNIHVGEAPPVEGRKLVNSASERNLRRVLQPLYGNPLPIPAQNGVSEMIRVPHGVQRRKEDQSATELLSLGSRPPIEGASVEDGEEVEQRAASPSVQSRSPVTAPRGISVKVCGARKMFLSGLERKYPVETCQKSGELPDTVSLKKRLVRSLETEGFDISTDCVNLLNNSLDAYIKRLIEPCVKIAASRAGSHHAWLKEQQGPRGSTQMLPGRNMQASTSSVYGSMLDFSTSLEMNRQVLGVEWPAQHEKICSRSWDT